MIRSTHGQAPLSVSALRRRLGASLVAGAAVLTVACKDGQPEAFATTAVSRSTTAAAGHVDSILPTALALQRFVVGLPGVTALAGAMPIRDSLVAAFMSAVGRGDSRALGEMMFSQAEYGYLYYPTSVYARKPYELPPEIAWMLNRENSEKAIGRVVQRLGGHRLELIGYSCGEPVTETDNRIWRECRVKYREGDGARSSTRQLFGAILERNGQFKFLSYASDF